MIEVRGLYKSFSGNEVLKDINLEFLPGVCNLIIGGSGSGKTVLMKSIVGLHKPEKGEVIYDGRVFNTMTPSQQIDIRKEIGMIFQAGALFDSMNVEENVLFPLIMFRNQSRREMKKRVDFCLDRVNLSGSNKLMPSELSGGMKKRVAIARAIAIEPRYLFCDEPNSGLDPQTAILIDNLIMDITKEFNITTIINTHDMNSVFEIGERIAYIYQGELWWEGSKDNVLNTDNKELNNFVFSSALTKRAKGI